MQTLFTLVLKIISIFIITVIVSIIVAQYVSKTRKFKNKNKKDLTKVGIVVGSILICIIGIIGYCKWYFGPLPGYSEEFIKKGNPMTRFEMDGYHQDMGTGGGFGIGRRVDYCMNQQDFNTDIKYAKEAGVYYYNYIVDEKNIKACKMINLDKIKEISAMLDFTSNYQLSKIGKRKEYIDIAPSEKLKVNINFIYNKLEKLQISSDISKIKKINLNLEGIETMHEITLYYKENRYTYKLKENGKLKEFLEDWGWLDKNGYYGKKYSKLPEKELIKTGEDQINDVSNND